MCVRIRFSSKVLSSWYSGRPVVANMSSSTDSNSVPGYNQLHQYSAPAWADCLTPHPPSYVQLAIRNTPIHPWNLPGVPEGFRVSVKRDDMTGCTLSGNKVRKLEFLLADAIEKGCDSVITCGGIQSNHARATAVACRQLGLQPHLILRWHGEMDPESVGCRGNLLLDRAVGSKVILVPPLSYEGEGPIYGKDMKGLKHKMEDYKTKLKAEAHVAYTIPVGGSTSVGTWGYIEAFRELMDQGLHENFDDVVVAVGSGGTLCGLAVANHLTGSKLKIHGVCVCDSADYFHRCIDEQLKLYGLTTPTTGGEPVCSRDIVDVIEGYKGQGYGLSTEEELVQLLDMMTKTGVELDPVYTLKGVRGMLTEMATNPGRFQGNRVLYIHTGGVFGMYDGRLDEMLKKTPPTNNIHIHTDIYHS